jgi:hypothetical protein
MLPEPRCASTIHIFMMLVAGPAHDARGILQGEATAWISAEVLDGQDTTFVILMNEIDQVAAALRDAIWIRLPQVEQASLV